MELEQLNAQFALDDGLTFEQDKGGFIQARIHNPFATAVISIYAAQVLSYRPADATDDLLFVSSQAHFSEGKAIKGGIPVCWPWFGPDPEHSGRPAHGFVRNRAWQVLETGKLDDGRTRLVLGLGSNNDTQMLWPYHFSLRIEFLIGDTLDVSLITTNESSEVLPLTQALHTYLLIGDIASVELQGLDGKTYVDKVDGNREKRQTGPLSVSSEVDRIYAGTADELIITDAALSRRIRIKSEGSQSVVVWNPWIDKAAAMDDFADDEYKRMLCVETANAGSDLIMLEPAAQHRLRATYAMDAAL